VSHPVFALSGSTGEIVRGDGQPIVIFDLGASSCLTPDPNGRFGMASIHIDVYDVDIQPFNESARANAMLLVDVRYATAGIGGEFTIDCTRGRILAVGGCDVIHLSARLASAIAGEAISPYATKRVTATLHWPTSISPKEVGVTLPSVDLTAVDGVGVPSAWFQIPRQAEEMLVYSPQPALFPTLLAEFAHSNAAGSPVRYATLDPNQNGTKIRHGVEFVRFTSPTAMTVFPDFTLAA
jgi:hypothetical protein